MKLAAELAYGKDSKPLQEGRVGHLCDTCLMWAHARSPWLNPSLVPVL